MMGGSLPIQVNERNDDPKKREDCCIYGEGEWERKEAPGQMET